MLSWLIDGLTASLTVAALVWPKRNVAGAEEQQSIFGSTAIGDVTKTREAFSPFGVTKCQAKNEHTAIATAIAHCGASTRSVNASTGDIRERDK